MVRLLDESDRGMSERDKAGRHRRWAARFSHTDFARLNLARALVMNPEVLVMHKPVVTFNDVEARKIVGLLRTHVDERGLHMPEVDRGLRRPRTVFLTTSQMAAVRRADAVYSVTKLHGVSQMVTEQLERHGEWLH